MKKILYYTFIISIIILALYSRFCFMNLRPLHSDEGVVGYFFANNILNGQTFKYSPLNYHGPIYQYIAAGSFLAFGINLFSLRFPSAIIGAILVILFLFLKFRDENFNKYGKYIAALFVLLSPSILYFSRDAIQETTFLLFSFLTMYFLIKVIDEKKIRFLPYSAITLALAFATKETAIFLLVSIILIIIFFYKDVRTLLTKDNKNIIIFSGFLFIFFYILGFSSFMQYPQGFILSILGYFKWGNQAIDSGHTKSFFYYILIILQYELTLVILAFIGGYYAIKKNNNFYKIIMIWVISIFLFYSITPYKTPWLIINITLPLAILAAIGLSNIFKSDLQIGSILAIITIAYLLVFSIQLNFINTWKSTNKLSYVQTNIDLLNIVNEIRSYNHPKILILSHEYWPLPFYLRGMDVNYLDSKNISNFTQYFPKYSFIIMDTQAYNTENLTNIRPYDLRDGVKLYLANNQSYYNDQYHIIVNNKNNTANINNNSNSSKIYDPDKNNISSIIKNYSLDSV